MDKTVTVSEVKEGRVFFVLQGLVYRFALEGSNLRGGDLQVGDPLYVTSLGYTAQVRDCPTNAQDANSSWVEAELVPAPCLWCGAPAKKVMSVDGTGLDAQLCWVDEQYFFDIKATAWEILGDERKSDWEKLMASWDILTEEQKKDWGKLVEKVRPQQLELSHPCNYDVEAALKEVEEDAEDCRGNNIHRD